MIVNNPLDKSFGPVGTTAGIFLFIAGLILVFFSFSGFLALVFGAFVGFTHTCTLIDYDRKRIKFSNNLFGFIRTGQWISIVSDMKIGIEKSNRSWRAYSRGNETLDMSVKDYRLIIFDLTGKKIMPIKKTQTLDDAKIELELFAKQFGVETKE